MAGYDADRIYELLPAALRQRDFETGNPLRDLIEIIGEQSQVLEKEMEQLYLNWFIETCEEWVVPYLGDLVGLTQTSVHRISTRAVAANWLGYKRRTGTLAVAEQLARDVTGWPARALEYFQLLSWNQNLNHLRLNNLGHPNLREGNALARLGGPFETTSHLVDVRDIEIGNGPYNLPNVGIYLWRLIPQDLTRASAHRIEDGTGLHYVFSPLGNDLPLFKQAKSLEKSFDLAEEPNVPDRISRHALHEGLGALYGPESSLALWLGEELVEPAAIGVCDLTDWQREAPADLTAVVDPELGRIAFSEEPSTEVRVRFHHGFSARIGGGSYFRPASQGTEIIRVSADPAQDAGVGVETFPTIGQALGAWAARPESERPSTIVIGDNSTYEETLPDIEIPEQASLTIRAANRTRPTVVLTGPLLAIGAAGGSFSLAGLLIAGSEVRVSGGIDELQINDCTLVPGRALTETGAPVQPGETSLRVEAPTCRIIIGSSIVGRVQSAIGTRVHLTDSIVDANDPTLSALEGLENEPGGSTQIQSTTVIGSINTTMMALASDSILLGTVDAQRRQQGCTRFSYVPLNSRVPRRFHCQPNVLQTLSPAEQEREALRVAPVFTSTRYGDPGYCQLSAATAQEIYRGAEDESEMGAFASLQQPLREDSLRIRLDEHLALGIRIGIFYAT